MVFRMARPTSRSGTKNRQIMRRIPADVKRILASLPDSYRPRGWGKDFITLSTGTADKRKADVEFSRMSKELEERFASLRAGVRSLTQKETVALAGTIYRAFAESVDFR